jgi:hypothetical protein
LSESKEPLIPVISKNLEEPTTAFMKRADRPLGGTSYFPKTLKNRWFSRWKNRRFSLGPVISNPSKNRRSSWCKDRQWIHCSSEYGLENCMHILQ